MAKNWHDKVWRMMVTEVLGKGELPSGGTPEVACKVEYAGTASRRASSSSGA